MKKKILTNCLAVFCLLLNTHSQPFQVTTGTNNPDEKWAVIKDDFQQRYVTIGNTVVNGQSRLWIASYNFNGALVRSANATNNRPMIARDISIAKSEGTTKPLYYVTGWTEGGGLSHMFVGCIDLFGFFVWYRENPFTVSADQKEGVAIVTAPNGDAVVVGNALTSNGSQVCLARFNIAGSLVWSNTYYSPGNWMAREIALGEPDPTCFTGTYQDYFIITGETSGTIPGTGPVTFAALYNGDGNVCWQNLYPALPDVNINASGDAGYDVVFEPYSKNYCIAGVVETNGKPRASAYSTPYVISINASGNLIASAVYTDPNYNPLGGYPRAVCGGHDGGDVVFAGPNYNTNRVFWGRLSNLASPLPVGKFGDYTGMATANSYTQPFVLNDAQPEGILFTEDNGINGYLISTNAWPVGVYGQGDGHFIRTDRNGHTPDNCGFTHIENKAIKAENQAYFYSYPIEDQYWTDHDTYREEYKAKQKFCITQSCIVNAAFTFTISGQTINFTNTSTGNGTLSYSWDFGDGSSSAAINPSHTYAGPGSYTVCLKVTNITASGTSCVSVICQTVITTALCNILAGFTESVACKTITYTNTSSGTGTLTYSWLFDDGTTSALINPVKTYANCGSHVTRLIVCNATCCDTIIKTFHVPCCTSQSNFCLTTAGTSTLLNISTQPNTTYTVFVNGTAVSWANNTSRVLVAGANTVCVKATTIYCGDTCCAITCKTISVRDACTINGEFSYLVDPGAQVSFFNPASTVTSHWDFGDGSTGNVQNPVHTYAAPGTYTVCLTVRRINGADTCEKKICKNVLIDPACTAFAQFRATHCTQTPLAVSFTNLSSGTTSYQWDFGDPASGVNNTSTAVSPSHSFTAPGSYVVCLQALVNNNCWSRTCYLVIVSSATSNTSCTVLPGTPIYRFTVPIIKENVMIPAGQENSGPAQVAVQKALPDNIITREGSLLLFPNPASQKVQVVFATAAAGKARVWVLNTEGANVYKKVLPVTAGSNQLTVPVAGLPAGVYYLHVETGGKQHKEKFVVDNH